MAPALAQAPSRLALPLALLALAGCPGKAHTGPPAGPSECTAGDVSPRAYDALAYELSARFDWDLQRLFASEEITLARCPGAPGRIELDATVAVARVHAGGRELPFSQDSGAETLSVDVSPLGAVGTPLTFTVEYQAPTSAALVATTSTDLDPVRSRVYFTDSEPRAGHAWLVEKDDPSDRARFSVTLEVEPGEDLVANGERVIETALPGGGRRIGYALDEPIPTYLMAFAGGELEHAERTYHRAAGGDLPLALWYRRGLVLDPAGNLDAVEDAMDTFERLLGPYPWTRYAVVLLPSPFGGGMENATITFDAEGSGQGWVSFSLNAHELAHHWFGDWVTMRTYDDVWVKEGMATLLAAEAMRGTRDLEGLGRLMGTDFPFDPDHAIVDPALTGIAKYTSGPYTRAATLLTQIRALVGEEPFWASCRAFLAAHANGSARGEQFVRAFSPHLDEVTIAKVLGQLPQKTVPAYTLTTEPAAGGNTVRFRVIDPGLALLAPITLTVVTFDGQATQHPVTPGTTLTVTVPWSGYLALDERDLRAYDEADDLIASMLSPSETGDPVVAAFLNRSAGQQERAMLRNFLGMTSEELPGFLAGLDSVYARRYALRGACAWYGTAGPEWQAALVGALTTPPVVRYDSSLVQRCGTAVGQAFEAELLALEAAPAAADLARLEYLLSFRYGPDGVAAIQRLSTEAPTLELRQLAASRLAREPAPGVGASHAPQASPGGESADDLSPTEGKAPRRAADR